MLNNITEIWSRILGSLRQNVSDDEFRIWFEPMRPTGFQNGRFSVRVPSRSFCETLDHKFPMQIRSAIREVLGDSAKLSYQVQPQKRNEERPTSPYNGNVKSARESFKGNKNSATAITAAPLTNTTAGNVVTNPFNSPSVKLSGLDSHLMRDYTFDNYVEGKANKFARSAGSSIAMAPGSNAFNPFVIYGQPGVGKTHLAQAVGASIKDQDPSKRVLYVTAERFTSQFIEANILRSSGGGNNYNNFINFYQALDVLIIDDIQGLIGKDKTQQSFFTIFNHLHQKGKQLIITCDKPPGELKGMNARLLSRFKWRLVAEIEEPCVEMRKSILRKNAIKNSIVVGEDVIDYLADNVVGTVRELEGAIITLLAYSTFEKRNIDISLAAKATGNYIKTKKKIEVTIPTILDAVCSELNVEKKMVLSKTRKSQIVFARQIAMFLSKKFTTCSLATIGREIAGRDHSTVVHACKSIDNILSTDPDKGAVVLSIQRILSQ